MSLKIELVATIAGASCNDNLERKQHPALQVNGVNP